LREDSTPVQMRILSIDPGIRAFGWVHYDTDTDTLLGSGVDTPVPYRTKITQASLHTGVLGWLRTHKAILAAADVVLVERQWAATFNTRLLCEIVAMFVAVRDGNVCMVDPSKTAAHFKLPKRGLRGDGRKKDASLEVFKAKWPGAVPAGRAHDVADAWLNLCYWREKNIKTQ
jgi:hypothetical protein